MQIEKFTMDIIKLHWNIVTLIKQYRFASLNNIKGKLSLCYYKFSLCQEIYFM